MSVRSLSQAAVSAVDAFKIEKVLAIIQQHHGSADPIRGIEVAVKAELTGRDPEREVQAIVKFLLEERSVPIGSKTSPPYGYYVIEDEKELRRNIEQLKRRALSTLRHMHALERASVAGPIVGQAEIEGT